MKLVTPGKPPQNRTFRGSCRVCGAVWEAKASELTIDSCPRERYEFAHKDCDECNARAPMAVILYPMKDQVLNG